MADRARGNARDIPNHPASIPGNTRMEATAEVGESGFPDLKELRDILREVDIAPLKRALKQARRKCGPKAISARPNHQGIPVDAGSRHRGHILPLQVAHERPGAEVLMRVHHPCPVALDIVTGVRSA